MVEVLAGGDAVSTGLHHLEDGFDVRQFGQPLSEQEQQQLEGRFWWSVAFGAADAMWKYGTSRPFQPRSWKYWAGMAATGAMGATIGALTGGYQRALQVAQPAERWLAGTLKLYGYLRTRVLNEAVHRGVKELPWDSWDL